MTTEERAVIRTLIDRARRAREGVPSAAGEGCGHPKSYQRGCRCDACRQASTEQRRRSRQTESARKREQLRATERWQRIRNTLVWSPDHFNLDLHADDIVAAIPTP